MEITKLGVLIVHMLLCHTAYTIKYAFGHQLTSLG